MTAAELKNKLNSYYPAVDFSVRKGSYSRGTNDGHDRFEVRYNFKRFPVAPWKIQALLPKNATLWVMGR